MKTTRLTLLGILAGVLALVSFATGGMKMSAYKPKDVKMGNGKDSPKLSSLKDNVVLILFARIGAEPSNNAAIALAEVAKAMKDKDVKSYLIPYCQDAKEVEKFVSEKAPGLTIVPDDKYSKGRAFEPDCIPCLFVVDKFGKVRHVGSTDKEKTGELVDTLLGEEEAGKKFTNDAKAEFAVGKPIPPIELKDLKRKTKDIYHSINGADYTFIIATGTT
ncbi:MAG: TlpA family protein disulfide reductase [Planctomycetota bacterium]